MLGAQLNESCAAVEKRQDEIARRPAGGCRRIDVENGVEARE
jgi:hypothetical protein